MRIPAIKLKTEHIIFGIVGLGIGAFIYLKFLGPKPIINKQPFERPPPTNLYVPDADISGESYNRERGKDYRYFERFSPVGWNIQNVHPTYQQYLNDKYGLF